MQVINVNREVLAVQISYWTPRSPVKSGIARVCCPRLERATLDSLCTGVVVWAAWAAWSRTRGDLLALLYARQSCLKQNAEWSCEINYLPGVVGKSEALSVLLVSDNFWSNNKFLCQLTWLASWFKCKVWCSLVYVIRMNVDIMLTGVFRGD